VDARPKSSTDLRRLRNIRADPRVAVLADHYEDDRGRLRWVRADGQASILDDPQGQVACRPRHRDTIRRGPPVTGRP
jgi:hypothetical protein